MSATRTLSHSEIQTAIKEYVEREGWTVSGTPTILHSEDHPMGGITYTATATLSADRQGELCAASLTEMQRCGIDARYESVKRPGVVTVSRSWREDLIDFKEWSPARSCWFGISLWLASAEQLLADLKRVDNGAKSVAEAVFMAARKRVVDTEGCKTAET